jgi:hypothetical protein
MTHNFNPDFLQPDKRATSEELRDKSGSIAPPPHSTQHLTLNLSLESKRKAYALALQSKRSIDRVIEELIENCPESAS